MEKEDNKTIRLTADPDSEFGKAQRERSKKNAKKNIDEAEAYVVLTITNGKEACVSTVLNTFLQAEIIHKALISTLNDLPNMVGAMVKGAIDKMEKK